jgi:hypothetical protein
MFKQPFIVNNILNMNSNTNAMNPEYDEWDDIIITTITPQQQSSKNEKNDEQAINAAKKRERILAANAETARLNQERKDEIKAFKAAEKKAKEEKEAEEFRQKQIERMKLEAELGSPEKIFKHDFKIINKHKFVHQKINRNGCAPIYTGMKELDDAADKAWKLNQKCK